MAAWNPASELPKLLNPDGSLHCLITESHARQEIRKGNIRRVSPKNKPPVYRMVQQADPSESKETMCQITLRDMNMAVGAQRLEKGREQEDLERLIGYGLIAQGTMVPERGYLHA
jgi:hypothetical protein